MSKYEKIKLTFLAVFLIGAIVILNNYSNNGRYYFVTDGNFLLDTRRGEMFFLRDRDILNLGDFQGRKEKKNNEVLF